MIKSSDLLIFFEKTNFSNRFSIRFLINSSHHLNFYHCNASSTYLSTICSFDSSSILKQLSQNSNRFMIFSSLLTSINLNKISINQTKLKNLLKSLNFYTFNHQIKLSRVKKTIDLISVDLILARDVIKMLFKANMIKKCWFTSTMMIRFKSVYCMSVVYWLNDVRDFDCYLMSDLYVGCVGHMTHANLMRSGYLPTYLVRLVKPFGQTLGPL
jgi:hypothetical protein